jgi:hypothetical protein
MALLTKEQILQATDVDIEEIEVPEWDGKVRVCGLDAQYVQRLIQSGFINPRTGEADMAMLDLIDLAARSLVDEDGEPLLSRSEAKTLGKRSFAPLMRVATKALQLSGLTAEDEDEAEPKNE